MADLVELEARVQALEDIRAIKTLKYRYLRACDRKDPDGVRDCLDPVACVIAYEGFPRFESREAFVDIFAAMACKPSIIDMHHGQNPDITLTGPDSATGVWDLFFHSMDTEARTALQMGCAYLDHYTRRDGRWWISHTETVRTSFLLQQVAADGAPRVLVMGAPPATPYGAVVEA